MYDDNLTSMHSRSQAVFAVTVTVFALATIFVFFRLLSRAWIVRKVSLDDYFMILAWVITFGLSFSICYGATTGLGRHERDVPSFWQGPLRKSQYAFSVLYQPALMAEKTSILVFYLTLSKSHKVFRWATIATMCVVNIAGFALLMTTIFQCRPISAVFEDPTPVNARCTDVVTIYLASSPVNIITDLALLFLPMPILTGMRLPKKQKLILVITFGFGIFVAVVDVVRVAYLQSASTYRLSQIQANVNDSRGGEVNDTDFSWYVSYSFMWTAIEVSIGIMCACVPGLKPLVSRFMPHFIHDTGLRTEQDKTSSDHTAELAAAQRVPSIPSVELEPKDFAPSDGHIEPPEDQAMGMMDFLTSPDGKSGDSQKEKSMGMMDFLTTPETDPSDIHNRLHRTETALTNTTRDTTVPAPNFFDFVNMKGKKSMVQMSSRESFFPVAMVTILFFIWGFEYGLLDVLNQQFQQVAGISNGQNVALHSAYFAGYFVGPLTFGRLVLKHWGFKSCYNVGLAIYACGTLVFWVAAVLTSFPTYVVVNFVVGMGLSTLEIAANAFIALCGPREYAEVRLNLSQGFQGVGTVIAPLIAAKGFTKYRDNAPSLINTQWAYLGIALFTILLAVAYYYVPLPEATDQELEDAAERLDGANDKRLGPVPIVWIILGLGVFSQFCYVGAQETFGTNIATFTGPSYSRLNETDLSAVAHAAFAASRFLSAALGFIIKPRIQLAFFYTGCIIFSALSMSFSGHTSVGLLITTLFFEGPLFSLIFAQSLRGMGKHTKDASVLLTAAISGGAVFPAISYAVSTRRGSQYSLCVALAAFVGGSLLAFAFNANSAARHVVDPIKESDSGVLGRPRPPSASSNHTGRVLSFFTMCKKHSHSSREGSVEYRERNGSADTASTTAAV